MLTIGQGGGDLGGGGGVSVLSTVNQAVARIGGPLKAVTGNDGARAIVTSATGNVGRSAAVEYRSNVAPAVNQRDQIDLNGIAAGGKLVIDFGLISGFLDQSATPLPVGDVLCIDPNGISYDLAFVTTLKTSGDGYYAIVGDFPPGRYEFYNISGGALTGLVVSVHHKGARNLA